MPFFSSHLFLLGGESNGHLPVGHCRPTSSLSLQGPQMMWPLEHYTKIPTCKKYQLI